MSHLIIIKDEEGQSRLLEGCFTYLRNFQSGSAVYWRCSENKTIIQCPVRVTTIGKQIVKRTGYHNHSSDVEAAEMEKLCAGICEVQVNTTDTQEPLKCGSQNTTAPVVNQIDERSSLGPNQQVPSQQRAEQNYDGRPMQTMPIAAAVSGSTMGTDTETAQVVNQMEEQSLEGPIQQSAEQNLNVRIAGAVSGSMVSAGTEASTSQVTTEDDNNPNVQGEARKYKDLFPGLWL